MRERGPARQATSAINRFRGPSQSQTSQSTSSQEDLCIMPRPYTSARHFLWIALAAVLAAGCQRSITQSSSSPVLDKMQHRSTAAGASVVRLKDKQKLDIQLALARTLELEDNLAAAELTYREILAESPKHAVATHRLAVVLDQQKRFEESSELFLKALKLSPGNPSVFANYGYSLYLQHRWAEAERNLRQAIELNPQDQRSHNHLGLVLAQTGRVQDAVDEFRLAGCSPAESHANAGMVLELNEQYREAREQYALAVDAQPELEPIADRVAMLDRLRQQQPELFVPRTDSSPLQLVNGTDSSAGVVNLRHTETVRNP